MWELVLAQANINGRGARRVRATMGCRQFRLARFQAERIPLSLSGSAADGFTFTMAANRRQRPAAA